MKDWIAIGIGCRRGSSGEAIAGLVRQALALVSPCRLEHNGTVEGSCVASPVQAPVGSRSPSSRHNQLVLVGGRRYDATLFTSEEKRAEQGMVAAATALRVPLVFLSHAVLAAAAARCRTRSARVEAMIGLPSLAEAAALAGAGRGSRLVLERISQSGVTCAIASLVEEKP